jgi:serine/threonine protein kinase
MVNVAGILKEHLVRYEVKERLGSGGMATVYRAVDKNLGRDVAIKVLHEHLVHEESFKERFEQEARFIASFNHPNIVRVYDFATLVIDDSKLHYMVMPYLSGKTLVDILDEARDQEKTLPHERIKQVVGNIAAALDYAHERGMIHRDVKPANIIFDENDQAILTDFGIARLAQTSGLTADGTIVGTPAYMSPEQATGQSTDHRSDIYALGCILFELLTGRTPFDDDGGTVAVLVKHAQEKPPLVSKYAEIKNPAIDYVLERALAKDPDDRYQKASALFKDLQETIDAENELDRRKASPMAPASATKQAATLAMDISPIPANRLTQTIHTMVIKPARQNPMGFAALAIALFALLVVARMAQAPSSPPSTEAGVDSMAGSVPIFFAADFSPDNSLNNSWEHSQGVVTREITDGEYRISNTEASRAITSLLDVEAFNYEDSYIVMEGRILETSASPTSAFGLVFRYQDSDNYYVFGVDAMSRFSIWKLQAGIWCELRTVCNDGENSDTWTENAAIHPLGESNIIGLNAVGTSLTGYVNGEEVFSLEDATFAAGAVGIYMATTNVGRTDVAINTYEVSAALSPTNSMTGDANSMTSDTNSMTGDTSSMTGAEATESSTEEAED